MTGKEIRKTRKCNEWMKVNTRLKACDEKRSDVIYDSFLLEYLYNGLRGHVSQYADLANEFLGARTLHGKLL